MKWKQNRFLTSSKFLCRICSGCLTETIYINLPLLLRYAVLIYIHKCIMYLLVTCNCKCVLLKSHYLIELWATEELAWCGLAKMSLYFRLAYGWSAGNLNWPIRIQQAGKIIVSWCKVHKSGKALKSGTFFTGDGVRYPRKGIFNFKNHTCWQKLKSMSHFVFLNFYFGAKNDRHINLLVVRRVHVSQGRIIIVLFWTQYAVPRQIKPGILKLKGLSHG